MATGNVIDASVMLPACSGSAEFCADDMDIDPPVDNSGMTSWFVPDGSGWFTAASANGLPGVGGLHPRRVT